MPRRREGGEEGREGGGGRKREGWRKGREGGGRWRKGRGREEEEEEGSAGSVLGCAEQSLAEAGVRSA